jgi:O-antigen ligase
VLVAAVCLVGLVETASEPGRQNVLFVYSVLAVLGCAAVTWMFNVRWVRPGMIDLMAAAMFGWYVAACFAGGPMVQSKLLEVCLCAPLYVSLRVLMSSHRNLGRWLLVVLCVCGAVEATVGMQQAFGARHSNHSLFSVTGTFFNPGPYGGYIAVMLSMAFGYVAKRWGFAAKMFSGFRKIGDIRLRRVLTVLAFCVAVCALVTTVIILPATMSRAAFVAVGVAAVAAVLGDHGIRRIVVEWVRRNRRVAVAIGIVSAVVVCGGIYGIYALKKDSADGRLLMWKMAVRVMLENPATGVGPGYYRGAYGDVQAEYFESGRGSETEVNVAGSPEYGFNEYLQIGAETGVPGLVLFVVLVAAALWRLFRARSPFTFGLLALGVFAFFSYPFSLLPMKTLFVVFLAAAGSLRTLRRETTIVQRIVTGIVLAGSIVAASWATKPYLDRLEVTREWQTTSRWYSMEMYSYVLDDYPAMLPLMGDHPAFLFEYGRSLNMEGRYAESLEIMNRAARLSNDPMNWNVIGNNHRALGQYDKAAESYLRAYNMVPSRMYPLYMLGQMYSAIGDRERAVHYARRVVGMTPKISSPATNDMQREMRELIENGGTMPYAEKKDLI